MAEHDPLSTEVPAAVRTAGKDNIVSEPAASKPQTKTRVERKFPVLTFQDALAIGEAIQQFAAGQKVRRLRLFEQLNKDPGAHSSRRMLTSSGQYGITKGSYTAEYLELTPAGQIVTAEDTPSAKRAETKFQLAIENIPPFRHLYDKYKGSKLPAKEILADSLNEVNIPQAEQNECVDTFIVNAQYLTLLRTIGGSERLVPIEQVVEGLGDSVPSSGDTKTIPRKPVDLLTVSPLETSVTKQSVSEITNEFDRLCFYVTPIGEPGSPERKHADFMLEYIVRPALTEFDITVVRADQMSQPGMIGKQVIEHILKCKLVIADLSFHNPNVFYELCLRHTTRLPTVQLKRASDRLPFDLNQQRTISIDTADIYGLYPKLQTHISEVATQVRASLDDSESADNPLSLYYPKAKLKWD